MKAAKWIFLTAGVFGLLTMVPMAFSERFIEQIMPPALNHPEFFYGFVLLNTCWQVLYLFVSTNPVRYRLIMLPSLLAKASGVVALTLLSMQGRISYQWIVTIAFDGAFALLFMVAFWLVGRESAERIRKPLHGAVGDV